jgi:capsular polysaccharide biosynthesis protein
MNTALADYGRVLRLRWRWIMWGILLALAVTTVFLILRPPMYRSEATVFVRTPGDVSRVLDGGDSYAQGRAQTYAALAGSTSVSSRVIADLGLDLKPEVLSKRIRATNPRGTALIDIAVSAPSAAEAQRTAIVLLSEYATTVRTLESVPGSLVPRAELVVIDPPGRPVRVAAWGVPIPVFLLCSALIGLVLGSTGAVLRSIFERPVRDPRDASRTSARQVPDVIAEAPDTIVMAVQPEPRSVRIRPANEGNK